MLGSVVVFVCSSEEGSCSGDAGSGASPQVALDCSGICVGWMLHLVRRQYKRMS